MKPKNNRNSTANNPSKTKIISCFLIAILLLFSGMDSAFLGDTALQGTPPNDTTHQDTQSQDPALQALPPHDTPPQQITAQSENDPLTLSRISLEDRIEVAEALLRDTEVQENGK
ncbi:MAG: hypothetical protein FWG87_15225, partial [Defluviitaleaceae bacterium]|nr:hypothetical protein [Defluviitaleaceae bacterium]